MHVNTNMKGALGMKKRKMIIKKRLIDIKRPILDNLKYEVLESERGRNQFSYFPMQFTEVNKFTGPIIYPSIQNDDSTKIVNAARKSNFLH